MIQYGFRRGGPWFDQANKIKKTLIEFALSERFHWTPKQIREMEYYDKLNYLALMKGEMEGKPKDG